MPMTRVSETFGCWYDFPLLICAYPCRSVAQAPAPAWGRKSPNVINSATALQPIRKYDGANPLSDEFAKTRFHCYWFLLVGCPRFIRGRMQERLSRRGAAKRRWQSCAEASQDCQGGGDACGTDRHGQWHARRLRSNDGTREGAGSS